VVDTAANGDAVSVDDNVTVATSDVVLRGV
jgi:hypothetical protein